jgi:predicted amidohydrolase
VSTSTTPECFDRSGNIVGKYRRTHPTVAEMVLKGVTPGDDYPVLETDFGRIGYQICYDNHFPEVARILSFKGAQIVLHPNMADNREQGSI